MKIKEKDGKALIKCSSHRARDKMKRALNRLPQSYWSLQRESAKGLYEVPVEELEKLKGIVGITRSYWSDDLMQTWSHT